MPLPAELQAFLNTQDCMPINDLQQVDALSGLVESISSLNTEISWQEQFQMPTTVLSAENYFIAGDTTTLNDYPNQSYSNIGINTQTNIMGIPLNLTGNAVLLNKQLDPKLSSFGLQYDYHRYLDQLKQQYLPIQSLSELTDMELNPLQLNEIEQKALQREVQLLLYRQILNNERFIEYRKAKEHELDSLVSSKLNLVSDQLNLSSKDSIRLIEAYTKTNLSQRIVDYRSQEKPKLDEQQWNTIKRELCQRALQHPKTLSFQSNTELFIDSLVQRIQPDMLQSVDPKYLNQLKTGFAPIQLINQNYKQLWQQKQAEDFRLWRDIRTKADKFEQQILEYQDTEYLKTKILQSDSTSKLQRLLLLTRGANIGLFSVNESELNIRHLVLNGIQYQYEDQAFFGQVSYGNQALNSNFFPSLGNVFLNRFLGRNFIFLQAGIGQQAEDHLSFAYLQARDVSDARDSTFSFPKFNRVFNVSGQKTISKTLALVVETGFSDYDLGSFQLSTDENPNSQQERLAATIGLNYTFPKTGLMANLSYFHIGSQYVTMGNPFLLTGRQGLSAALKARLFDNKLLANATLKYGHGTREEATFEEWQIMGELSYQFGKQNTVSARFMPNLFDQAVYDYNINVTSNIYTIQSTLYKEIGGIPSNSVLSLTNLRTDFQYLDSLQVNDATYLYVQELWLLGANNTLSATWMLGVNQWWRGDLEDFLFQLDYKFPVGKQTISGGGQLLKQRQYDGLWQYGLTTQMNFKIWESLSLNCFLIYRNFLKQSILKGRQLLGNLSLQYAL